MEESKLTRQERRELEREEKKKNQDSEARINNLKSGFLKAVVFLLIVAGIAWLVKEATKPLPGQAVEQLGRDHVTDIADQKYNSNPPTSGAHFVVWAKQGVYDRIVSDGYLIHSLEHGYIVISYDCTKPISLKTSPFDVYAHDEPAKESSDSGQLLKHLNYTPPAGSSWITPQNLPDVEVKLPDQFSSEACKSLVAKLSEATKVAERVIVVPRTNMDTLIALTAWGRIDKLDSYNKDEIGKFIKAFHNKGPEKTMEK